MRSLFRSRKPTPEPVLELPPPEEDILKQLVDYDVVILMDDSGSMKGSRWKHAKKIMKQLVVTAVKYDEDGIEIQFLNDDSSAIVKTSDDVKHLFNGIIPEWKTPLGSRLDDICTRYLQKLEMENEKTKRCLIIAITDGKPDDGDRPKVYSTIKDTCTKLDMLDAPNTQLGIQFVQIGKDPEAARFLRQLDDDLKGDTEHRASRDIVDTEPYTGVDLTSAKLVKILAGAINRKVDNQRNRGR